MVYKRTAFLTSLLLAASLVASSAQQTASVDDYVKTAMTAQKIPAVSIAVVRNGEIVKAKGYGLANVELTVAATTDTISQSGSVGKQFNETLAMMLVEEGRMSLDNHIRK